MASKECDGGCCDCFHCRHRFHYDGGLPLPKFPNMDANEVELVEGSDVGAVEVVEADDEEDDNVDAVVFLCSLQLPSLLKSLCW